MKKLFRPDAPECLARFRHGYHNWDDLNPGDRQLIWLKLDKMQGGFCAYCECELKKKHIEHFRNKSGNPHLTFDWNNLFGSCDAQTHCGHYKDSKYVKAYSAEELVKPDIDNPEDYLVFLTNGRVKVKHGLNELMTNKAIETIRVFNLDGAPSLVGSRKSALTAQRDLVTKFYELQDEFTPEEFNSLLESELANLEGREYRTALVHAWRFNLDY